MKKEFIEKYKQLIGDYETLLKQKERFQYMLDLNLNLLEVTFSMQHFSSSEWLPSKIFKDFIRLKLQEQIRQIDIKLNDIENKLKQGE